MSMMTQWGYTITDADSLADMLTPSEFETFTSGQYTDTAKIEAEISSASSAFRNYVGWHLYPSHECELNTTFYDERIAIRGSELLIQLPATFVSSVESVAINGTEYDSFVIMPNGLLRVYGFSFCYVHRYSSVVVNYTAGLTGAMMGAVKELMAHRVTHSLAVPAGVTSQATGGVSVTYNANWVNSARATALPDDNKEVLAPYKLRGVF